MDENGTSVDLHLGCFIQRIPGRNHSILVNADVKWPAVFPCLGKGLYDALSHRSSGSAAGYKINRCKGDGRINGLRCLISKALRRKEP